MLQRFNIPIEVWRFIVVGCCNTALNYVVYLALLLGAGWNYLVAGAVGFFSGAITGFIFNRLWTFQSSVAVGTGMAKYLAVQLFCLGINSATQWTAATMLGIPQTFSQLAGIAVTMVLNFLLIRAFVFTERSLA